MNRQEIWGRLIESFREVFEEDEIVIGPETTAEDIEDWDSLTHIQLMVAIETDFGIHFNTGEVAGLANVGEMVDLIATKTVA